MVLVNFMIMVTILVEITVMSMFIILVKVIVMFMVNLTHGHAYIWSLKGKMIYDDTISLLALATEACEDMATRASRIRRQINTMKHRVST